MTTKESLGIYWKNDTEHQEVNGMTYYGLWKDSLPNNLYLDKLTKLWKEGKIDFQLTRCESEEYKVYCLDLHLIMFPPQAYWLEITEDTLAWFVEAKAVVSWCGVEDCSPNPEILNPQSSFGNVYAAYSPEMGFICNADLDSEMKYLEDEQLASIYMVIAE